MEHRPPVKLDEGEIRLALGDADTPGLLLFTIVLWTFGPAVFGDAENEVGPMDPSEMWAGLNERYGTWVTEEGENKLNAILAGITGGMFWTDSEVFRAVSTSLYDGDLGDMVSGEFEDLTALEIMWAMLEMELVWDGDAPEFSWRVQAVIDEVLSQEQDDQSVNLEAVDEAYKDMLDQLLQLGVPTSSIRLWDGEYADVVDDIIAAGVSDE